MKLEVSNHNLVLYVIVLMLFTVLIYQTVRQGQEPESYVAYSIPVPLQSEKGKFYQAFIELRNNHKCTWKIGAEIDKPLPLK